jgi:hypothetical protein
MIVVGDDSSEFTFRSEQVRPDEFRARQHSGHNDGAAMSETPDLQSGIPIPILGRIVQQSRKFEAGNGEHTAQKNFAESLRRW